MSDPINILTLDDLAKDYIDKNEVFTSTKRWQENDDLFEMMNSSFISFKKKLKEFSEKNVVTKLMPEIYVYSFGLPKCDQSVKNNIINILSEQIASLPHELILLCGDYLEDNVYTDMEISLLTVTWNGIKEIVITITFQNILLHLWPSKLLLQYRDSFLGRYISSSFTQNHEQIKSKSITKNFMITVHIERDKIAEEITNVHIPKHFGEKKFINDESIYKYISKNNPSNDNVPIETNFLPNYRNFTSLGCPCSELIENICLNSTHNKIKNSVREAYYVVLVIKILRSVDMVVNIHRDYFLSLKN
jgi:hypothetical protein